MSRRITEHSQEACSESRRAFLKTGFAFSDSLDGAVKMAPTLNGKRVAVRNRETAREMPGVVEMVQAKDAVNLVAQSYWQAKKGCDALDVQWDEGGAPRFDSATILAQRKAALMASQAKARRSVPGDAAAFCAYALRRQTGGFYLRSICAIPPRSRFSCRASQSGRGSAG